MILGMTKGRKTIIYISLNSSIFIMLSVCLRGHVNTSSYVGAMRFWVRFWEAVSRMQWCQRISTEKRCNRNKAQDVCYATLCERLYRERWVSTTGSKVLEKTVRGRPDEGFRQKVYDADAECRFYGIHANIVSSSSRHIVSQKAQGERDLEAVPGLRNV